MITGPDTFRIEAWRAPMTIETRFRITQIIHKDTGEEEVTTDNLHWSQAWRYLKIYGYNAHQIDRALTAAMRSYDDYIRQRVIERLANSDLEL